MFVIVLGPADVVNRAAVFSLFPEYQNNCHFLFFRFRVEKQNASRWFFSHPHRLPP